MIAVINCVTLFKIIARSFSRKVKSEKTQSFVYSTLANVMTDFKTLYKTSFDQAIWGNWFWANRFYFFLACWSFDAVIFEMVSVLLFYIVSDFDIGINLSDEH